MGIALNRNLLGVDQSRKEGINFVSGSGDIKIAIVNLMPFKAEVEYQFFNVLGRYDEMVEIDFFYPTTHTSKNFSMDYIKKNYLPLDKLDKDNYHGLIVTGAPVEELPFEEVNYWDELNKFYKDNTLPSIYICWGSQGALHSRYGVKKFPLEKKLFGIYEHKNYKNPFITNDFLAPHSRNTYNKRKCIEDAGLKILSYSEDAGVYMCSSSDYRDIFISGHGEYQRERLKYEYERDQIEVPQNYYPDDDPELDPNLTWDEHRKEFYKNWLSFVRRK